jgi:hypothetical protein
MCATAADIRSTDKEELARGPKHPPRGAIGVFAMNGGKRSSQAGVWRFGIAAQLIYYGDTYKESGFFVSMNP